MSTASYTFTPASLIPATSQISGTDGSGEGGRDSAACRYMFTGEIANVRALMPVLKAICVKRIATMAITDRGLKISSEEGSRALQATAFIDRNLFRKFELRNNVPQSLCFRMSDLLTTLTVLFPSRAGNVSGTTDLNRNNILRIKYESVERLKLQVVNEHSSAMAYVNTFIAENLLVFTMSFVNKIILDASVLIDFWKCADTKSAFLTVKMDDRDPFFELSTESERGRFVNRIMAQSAHVEHYECTVPMSNRYEMPLMHLTLRPLLLATKVSIRIDSVGLLNVQFLIRLDSNPFITDTTTTTTTTRINQDNNRTNVPLPPTPTNTPTNRDFQHSADSSQQDVQKCFIELYIVPTVDAM